MHHNSLKNIMKTIVTLLILTLLWSSVSAQETVKLPKGEFGDNEIRINMLNSLIGSLEFQYERLLPDNSGIGVNIGVGYGDDAVNAYNTIVNLTPAYRVYFSKKKAAGFFIEGSTRFSYDRNYFYNDYFVGNNYYYSWDTEERFNVGLGLGIGAKMTTKGGLVGSVKGGIGRFLTTTYPMDGPIYPNIEIAIGKRF